MSEAYKRALVKGWCEAVTAAPFVPTINDNTRPDPTMSTWFTIIWEPDQIETIDYCGTTQETGLLNLIVGGEPNLGDTTVARKSDLIRIELLAHVDGEGMLTLERAQPTTEDSAGTADRWYRLRTPLDYRYIFAPAADEQRTTEFGIVRTTEAGLVRIIEGGS